MTPEEFNLQRRANLQNRIRDWIGDEGHSNPDETACAMMKAAMLIWDAETRAAIHVTRRHLNENLKGTGFTC